MQRVPVLSQDFRPLMPAKASRIRRWLKEGKAKVVYNDLGIFQVQLIAEPSGFDTQTIVLGIDPGKLFTGIAVQTSLFTLVMLHLELPFKVVTERMTTRQMMRRTRRARHINRQVKFKFRNHRQKRFDNRKQKGLPPSINANKMLEQRVISELLKVYPVSNFVYEIVKAKGDKGFSPTMVGQLQQIQWLESLLPTARLEGWETSILRRELGLHKNKQDKSMRSPATHAVDGVALAASQFIQYKIDHIHKSAYWTGNVQLTNAPFIVVSRPPYSRRQLHLLQFSKGGERRKYGGSKTLNEIRKGDLVLYKSKSKQIAGYCSGSTGNNLSISDSNWSRLGRFAVSKVKLLARNTGLVVSRNLLAAIPKDSCGAGVPRVEQTVRRTTKPYGYGGSTLAEV